MRFNGIHWAFNDDGMVHSGNLRDLRLSEVLKHENMNKYET